MISLTCTNCRTLLKIDDAFAGGVCRCQHCGAIQTVPSHLKSKPGVTRAKPAKTLYSRNGGGAHVPDTGPSSGLDELAQVVASSGLESGRLRSKSVESPRNSAVQSQTALVIAVSALTIAVVGVGLFLALRTTPQPPAAPIQSTIAAPAQAVPAAAAPQLSESVAPAAQSGSFCGVPIEDRVVIYVLDRGSGTADLFSYLKEEAFRSAKSLGADRKFKIIFWDNGSEDAFPSGNPTFATDSNVESARRALDGVFASGQTDVGSALTQAVNNNPDLIVLATGKGWQLDNAFIDQVMKIRGDRPIKFYTFTLGGTEPSAALKTIAQQTGGKSVLVSEGELKQAATQ